MTSSPSGKGERLTELSSHRGSGLRVSSLEALVFCPRCVDSQLSMSATGVTITKEVLIQALYIADTLHCHHMAGRVISILDSLIVAFNVVGFDPRSFAMNVSCIRTHRDLGCHYMLTLLAPEIDLS